MRLETAASAHSSGTSVPGESLTVGARPSHRSKRKSYDGSHSLQSTCRPILLLLHK